MKKLPFRNTLEYLAAIAAILALIVAILQLAVSLNDSTAVPPTQSGDPPTRIPASPHDFVVNELRVGGEATISADASQRLYLYYEPRLSSITNPIPLFDGERVQIVDGPENADGYRWWKVTTIDMSEGWLRETFLTAE